MRTLANGMGYLLVDNRTSGGRLDEADLFGCNHCDKLMRRQDWREEGGFCHCCARPVCLACAHAMDIGGCVPSMKKLEQAVEQAYRREQNAKILGL